MDIKLATISLIVGDLLAGICGGEQKAEYRRQKGHMMGAVVQPVFTLMVKAPLPN